jgi:hypothetical protein
MIGKSGTGGSFRGLANYLEGEEKLEFKEARNLAGDYKDHYVRMMEDTASMSRAEKPVYHMSISYSPEDHPTQKMMLEDADEVLKKMGLSEHQAMIISHQDKAHQHLHVMVNRVHPETGKAWNPWNDRQKYRPILRGIEAKREYTQLLKMDRTPPEISLSRGEYQQLKNHGLANMPLKAKAEFYEVDKILDQADRWEDVRQSLSDIGLKITRKGRGGVIENISTGKQMKLSRVGRRFSFGKLEKRFGKRKEFEKALKAQKTLKNHLPDQDLRRAFGQFAREGIGGKPIRKTTRKAFRKSLSNTYNIGQAVKGLTSLAASSNPLSGAAKLGLKIATKISKQLNKSRGRGLSR